MVWLKHECVPLGSEKGPIVPNPKQAIAIALSHNYLEIPPQSAAGGIILLDGLFTFIWFCHSYVHTNRSYCSYMC